ncbi:MAG: hypothetical protein AAGI52_03815 [Bacteroidota bacterium]
MGQQQLLLLVLGVIIVALAVLVGIFAFSENRRESAKDELVTATTRIASDAIAWSFSAAALGGGGGDPAGITFSDLSYDEEADGSYLSGDGVYTIDGTAARLVVRGEIRQQGSFALTAVFGSGRDCLVTVIQDDTAPTEPSAPAGCAW